MKCTKRTHALGIYNHMMIKCVEFVGIVAVTVEEIERAVARLPPEEFAQFCAWLEEFEMAQSTKDGFYHASEEELLGIERGLRASAEGKIASAENVAETFAKFRAP